MHISTSMAKIIQIINLFAIPFEHSKFLARSNPIHNHYKIIAKATNLSFRIIQHHLDNIRYNNDFSSIKELLLCVNRKDT